MIEYQQHCYFLSFFSPNFFLWFLFSTHCFLLLSITYFSFSLNLFFCFNVSCLSYSHRLIPFFGFPFPSVTVFLISNHPDRFSWPPFPNVTLNLKKGGGRPWKWKCIWESAVGGIFLPYTPFTFSPIVFHFLSLSLSSPYLLCFPSERE